MNRPGHIIHGIPGVIYFPANSHSPASTGTQIKIVKFFISSYILASTKMS